MKVKIRYPIVFAISFFWLGLLISISFLETPLKFQVTGMTLPIALELGKIMFGISTNIQLGLIIFIIFNIIIYRRNLTNIMLWTIFSVGLILVLEKFWMLPVLDARADILVTGKGLAATPLHDYFIYAESIKTILVALLGVLQIKKIKNEYY